MKIVNKKKFIRTTIILLAIIIALLSKVIAKEEEELAEYTITTGDTLWTIAQENKQEGEDTREYVYKIQKINNLFNQGLSEGQVIKIIK